MAIEEQGSVEIGSVAPETQSAPEAAPAAAAPATPQETDPNAELWKKLESIDFKTLPQSVKEKLELPFKQDYTQKWQKLAEDKNQFLTRMAERLGAQGQATPQQSALAALREKVQMGDYSEFDRFVEQAIQERVAPISSAVAQREAFDQARRLHPYVTEREGEIAEVIRSNPTLAQMAIADNYKFFPVVAHGIALSLEAQALKAQLAETQKNVEAQVKKGVEAQLAKMRGLPASTTRVGTGTATPTKEYATFREAAEAALAELATGTR